MHHQHARGLRVDSAQNDAIPGRAGGDFPGPRGHWFSGCIRPMRHDPLKFYTRTQREYGHYVRICAVPSMFVHMLTHPDGIEHVLLKNHRNYRKPDIFYTAMGLIGGDGLFTSEGDLWKRQRQMA